MHPDGNPKARRVIASLLEPADELWRGLGVIPQSGLTLKPEFSRLDAIARFDIPALKNIEAPGCVCAEVIQGLKAPTDCVLFGKSCTPEKPVGPCMVSSEGTCAAYYRYGEVL